jgi:TonB family protein
MSAAIVVLVLAALVPAAAGGQATATVASNVAARETRLKQKIAAAPADPQAYLDLAQLQEDFGAIADAEATLLTAHQAFAANPDVTIQVAYFYNRRAQFEKTIEMFRIAAASDPKDSEIPYMIATFYFDKIYRDASLVPTQRETYIGEGLAAANRALALEPDYREALVYKGLLLKKRAELVTDSREKARIIAEADALRNRATELVGKPVAARRPRLTPTPSPTPRFVPPPPAESPAPVTVGGDIKPPARLKGVPPVYPADAVASRTEGTVVVEATIDTTGRVSSATIRRSVPSLDQAALDAVRQWLYEPTKINGQAVPVIMTVTVSFTLQ